MAELLWKAFAVAFAAVVALSGATVPVETQHVLGVDGEWGPAFDVGSWLSGRIFRVGDKISFNFSGIDDGIAELASVEDFHSCDITNPIHMYTDRLSHIELEKEGVRYFASPNLENCKNGLKLHVPIVPHEYGPVHEPAEPLKPPPPAFDPLPPPPAFGPPLQPIIRLPPPAFGPPPPPPPTHSAAAAATYLYGLSLVLLITCYVVV